MAERKIAVLGAGAWGTAVAVLLAGQGGRAGQSRPVGEFPVLGDERRGEVVLWARSLKLVEQMRQDRRNDEYLPNASFPPGLSVTSSLEIALGGAHTCFVAVPSRWLREVVQHAAPHVEPGCVLVSLAKGIEVGSLLRMSEVLSEVLPSCPVAVVTGPNLAEEVVAGLPTATVVASRDPAAASGVRAMVSFPHLRAYTNDDVIGAEVAGAGKNVLALGAGMVDGLGAGDNARAAMVTRGVAELARLGVAAGGQALTFAGLAGLGDIVLTCTSRRSRNWSVGYALGLGHPLQQVLAGLHHVAEGVASAEPVVQLGHRLGVELPICEQVAAVVAGHCTPAQALEALLGREAAEAAHELAGLSGSAGEPPAGM